jgi:hypothetical protein
MGDTAAQLDEETFVENPFGTVTSKRVIYYRAKGWFSGGSREDIPLKHVTSVRLDISRSILGAVVLILLGIVCLAAVPILGILILALAVLLLWGSPAVVVNTAGQDLKAAKGLPWQRGDAEAFVDALRKQLFK